MTARNVDLHGGSQIPLAEAVELTARNHKEEVREFMFGYFAALLLAVMSVGFGLAMAGGSRLRT